MSVADQRWPVFFKETELRNLIDSALRSNPDLHIAMQKIIRANADVLMNRRLGIPSINGVISAGVDKFGDYTMNGVGNFDTNLSPNIDKDQKIPDPVSDLFLGLKSSWEINFWGKYKNLKKAALSRFEASREYARFVKTNLVSEIAGRYYELTAFDNELSIIQKNIRLQTAAVEMVKAQKEVGQVTELAVQQFKAQLLFTEAAEFRVHQLIAETENDINSLLGRYPMQIKRDSGLFSMQSLAALKIGTPGKLLKQRPDIKQAELELKAAKADVLVARAAYYPSLTLNPYLGLNAFKPSLLFSGGSLAMGVFGGLTAPLFNQRKIKANHIISIAANKEAYYNYRKVVVNAYLEVVTELNNISNLKKALSKKKLEVDELQKAVTSATDIYLVGRASYLEIISAQKGVLEAELQLNELKKQILLSRLNLYRLLGGG